MALLKAVPQDSFLSNLFLVTKKDGGTGHQPKMPKFIRGVFTLQNGRHSNLQEPRETRGLVSEGRLFFSPDRSGSQEVPVCFTLGERTYQFTCLPFGLTSAPWDSQAHSSSRTRVGVSSSNLYRRHTADGRVGRYGTGTRHGLDIYTPGLRYSLGTTSFFFLIFASIVLFFFLSSFKLHSLPKRTLFSRIISVIVNEWHLRSDSLPSSPSSIVYECVE